MKLNFKDLKQQKFTIDAEPSDTIGQLKEKIAAEKGWEAPSQKLIYSGKILADANTIESYKIEEKGFIVCMVSKPKAPPAPKPVAAAAPPATPAQPASTPAQPPAPQHQTAPTTSNVPSTPSPAQPAAAAAPPAGSQDPNTMLLGNQSEATVAEMEAMGFDRRSITRALRAAFGNPDRAIEYLLNGIPAHIEAEQQQQQQQRQAATGAGGQGPTSPPAQASPPVAQTSGGTGGEEVNLFEAAAAATGGTRGSGGGQRAAAGTGGGATAAAGLGAAAGAGAGAGGEVDMAFLRNSPYFQQIRQLVQQQPAMLEPILQQVAEGNPQLAQMIGQNQEAFLQLLAEDMPGEGEGALPPGAVQLSVTEEEREAIERLCRLGFSRDAVIQAYFVCDKNEELAANFLFEQPDDDDDQPPAAS